MFIISTWDLGAVTPGNSFCKYADDATLVVPASNTSSIAAELANVAAWSALNNQTLNVSKTSELVVSLRWTRGLVLPPLTRDMVPVTTLLLLGVLLDIHLSFAPHVAKTLAQASQSMHALKVLKTSGLPLRSLSSVCRATLVARLLYASPCWWGDISEADKLRLQATLRRAVAWGVCSGPPLTSPTSVPWQIRPSFTQSWGTSTTCSGLSSPSPPREHTHNLRVRG